jgi:exosome complex RNA-binding protein Csl4
MIVLSVFDGHHHHQVYITINKSTLGVLLALCDRSTRVSAQRGV